MSNPSPQGIGAAECPTSLDENAIARFGSIEAGDHVIGTLNGQDIPDLVVLSATTNIDSDPGVFQAVQYKLYNPTDETINTTGGQLTFDFVAWR